MLINILSFNMFFQSPYTSASDLAPLNPVEPLNHPPRSFGWVCWGEKKQTPEFEKPRLHAMIPSSQAGTNPFLSQFNCCSYGRHCDMQYVDLGECWPYLTEPGFSWHINSLNELPIWGEVVWHRDYNSLRIDWWQRFIMIIQILHLESTCASR